MSQIISLLTYPFNLVASTNTSALYQQLSEVYPSLILHPEQQHAIFYDFSATFTNSFWKPFSAYALKLGHQHFRYTGRANMLPVLEWGFNWFVSGFNCQYLCIHAAVVEKNNVTVILPAPPGSGKSTMCALMMLDGWRLLSDEHCLLDLSTLEVVPFVRPVSLKNNSIDIIQRHQHDCKKSRVFYNTLKGRIQYLAPTEYSWKNYKKSANANYIIFPKYVSGLKLSISDINQTTLFRRLLENTFNYTVLGERSFHALTDWLPRLNAIDLQYSDNEQMLAFVGALT
jgi:HprK-related kinase A